MSSANSAKTPFILCKKCEIQVTVAHKDDANTQFYKCPNCGYIIEVKPLELNEFSKKLRLAYEIQAEQNGERYIDPLNIFASFCDAKGKFKPALVADWIKVNHKFKTDIKTEILYFYNGKTWIQDAEPYFKQIVANLLGENDRESHYTNVHHHLTAITYENIVFSCKIAVENGLLDVETQTKTDFNPDEMVFYKLPVVYDPEAKCPNWEEFIKQVLSPDDIATLQEWSGYLLLPDYRFHKLLFLYGEGRNGKGVWQRTMEAILGEKNISSIGLEEFDGNHRFALKQLYGKLFNPCSEPTTNRILQTPLLKKATGQDTIEAEIKGKQARLSFRNPSKITVLANKFPRVNDQTTAFKERRLFIKFPNKFLGKDQIQNLEKIWLDKPEERSGILNWMLAGLKRLLDQGAFTESKTQLETEAEFLRASDTIDAFLTEIGILDRNRVTTRSEAKDAYLNYCDVLGLEAENERKFTQRLKETPKISICLVRKPKQERAWKGLGLKTIDDEGKISSNDTLTTLDTGLYPQQSFLIEKVKESITHVSSVSDVSNQKPERKSIVKNKEADSVCEKNSATLNPEVYKDRYCAVECVNYHTPQCPHFNRLDKETPLPLKCYGFKQSNSGEDV